MKVFGKYCRVRLTLVSVPVAVAGLLAGCTASGSGTAVHSITPPVTVAPPKPSVSRAVPTAKPAVSQLPLAYPTHDATQVITVVGNLPDPTEATVQAWTKVAGGWQKHGKSVVGHVGSDGIGPASESTSHTPPGSFTLTRAFGHNPNPGTSLPYTPTTPDYWWISQAGPLYNTLEKCSTGCSFDNNPGSSNPNEHLYYETPFYNYAVVIDYNTRNAPGGVRQGAGSAFFFHVTNGHPTAGCVSIDQAKLMRLMRWLKPADHPRMLIGVA